MGRRLGLWSARPALTPGCTMPPLQLNDEEMIVVPHRHYRADRSAIAAAISCRRSPKSSRRSDRPARTSARVSGASRVGRVVSTALFYCASKRPAPKHDLFAASGKPQHPKHQANALNPGRAQGDIAG